MTEAEWLAATDPAPMLEFLRGKASDRKLRLFACEFYTGCHGIDSKLLDDAVRKAEKWADGESPGALGELSEFYVCLPSAWQAAEEGAVGQLEFINNWGESSHRRRHEIHLADTLRCMFAFHHSAFSPTWLTSTVVALAAGIYADRAFDRLPILADALQDAGCEDAAVLGHLRGPGPHVRGCWVLDLILGKT